MKTIKKLAVLLLSLCLAVPAFTVAVSAAQGTLMFSDPSTKVGETVEVDLVVRTRGVPIGDAEVVMKYDAEAIEFLGGEGVEEEGSGSLTYSGGGTGTETELRTTMRFKALHIGDTKITVERSKAYLYSDETLSLTEGSSVISIQVADDGTTSVEPTPDENRPTDIAVSVSGTQYRFSDGFSPADIPGGFKETSLPYEGADHKFVVSDSGIYLGYLVNVSGEGDFFLYDQETSSFAPYVQLLISDTTSLILLDKADSVSLPDSYQQVDLTVSSRTFPAWANPEYDRFYVIHGLNTRTGESGLYQYDTEDGTYQSFELKEESEPEKEEAPAGKLERFLAENFVLAAAAVCGAFLILFIILIVVSVKLVHRNQELDDIYDEYDIPFDDDDYDDDSEENSRSRRDADDDDDFDDGDDYSDDDFSDLDSYDDADFSDVSDYGEKDAGSQDDYGDDFEVRLDDGFLNDGDSSDSDDGSAGHRTQDVVSGATKEVQPVKRKAEDDSFDIDFVDI